MKDRYIRKEKEERGKEEEKNKRVTVTPIIT